MINNIFGLTFRENNLRNLFLFYSRINKHVIILSGSTSSSMTMEEKFVLYYNQELWKKQIS